MKRFPLKLVLINVGLTVGLLFGVNLLANLVLLIGGITVEVLGLDDDIHDLPRSNLPNYEGDEGQMAKHFAEQSDLPIEYAPYIGWSRATYEGVTITINDQGDRIHDPLEGDRANIPSIYMFGGSTMWGTGAVDNRTIPAIYQRLAEIPTINEGETGFVSAQSLINFINLVNADTEMSGVVFYDGVNDVQYGCRAELEVNDHARTRVFRRELGQIDRNENEGEEFLDYLNTLFFGGIQRLTLTVEDILDDMEETQREDESMICDDDPEQAQAVAEQLLTNWEMAYTVAQSENINFLAVLQPVAFIGNPRLDHLEGQLDRERGRQYKAVYPILQELIQDRNYDWIVDYTDILSNNTYYYIDFCHLSPNGNRRIARQLQDDIEQRWTQAATTQP